MIIGRYTCAAVVVAGATWLPEHFHLPAGMIFGFILASLVAATLLTERERLLGRTRYDEPAPRSARQRPPRRALIVGAGPVGQRLAHALAADERYEVVGFADDPADPGPGEGCRILGDRAATSLLVREHQIDEVFLVPTASWQQQLAEDLTSRQPQVRVRVVPTGYEARTRAGRVESCGDIALLPLHDPRSRRGEAAKRASDLLLSLIGLMLFGPLMLVVAALVRLTSSGPAFFAQERVGRNGRSFQLYKFRTMVQDAEARTGPVLSSGRDDARLTALGRWLKLFRIDELPQLWNVVRGEMSMVGPRPERPCFVQEFDRVIPGYRQRHQVRPGITGLAQVCGGYHTRAEDKLRFDLLYVAHQSPWFDLVILVRTVWVVLTGRH